MRRCLKGASANDAILRENEFGVPGAPLRYMNQTNNKKEKVTTYFLYCRKSTDEKDRQVLSLGSQETEAVQRFGSLKIIKLPHESVSAFEPDKRPVFKNMIERIKKGEAQGIIAWHPDRLSRNPKDAAEIIYLLDIGALKDLKFCSYYFDNSPEGKMMLQITLSQSKYSSDKLSKDVKRGMDKKAQSGWRPGLATLGYINSKTNFKGEQVIYNDPLRFNRVKQMWQMFLTGNYTVPQIYEVVSNEWKMLMPATRKRPERKMQLSCLYKIFTNPFYYGWYEWPIGSDNWIQGKHEAMITEKEFNQAQFLLGKKGKQKPHTHRFAFTGLVMWIVRSHDYGRRKVETPEERKSPSLYLLSLHKENKPRLYRKIFGVG